MQDTNPEKKDKKLKVSASTQKLKILYLKEILEEETDYEHGITMPQIINKLKAREVSAERKSVYDDIRVLRYEYGLPIEHEEGARTYRLAEHMFELSEVGREKAFPCRPHDQCTGQQSGCVL